MLTVLMPVYNAERYLAEAVGSVLSQTHRDFELLVADDGSTDGSLDLARSLAAGDARVRVITHRNMGIADSLNEALEQVEGDWVVCMHADDVMMPNRIERQLAFLRGHPELAVASSLVYWIDPAGKVIGRSRSHLTTPEAVAEAVKRNESVAFPHPAVVFRKSVVRAVGGYRQRFFPAEDTELWNRIVDAGHRVLVQPEYLLKYRMHPSSASTTKTSEVIVKLRWMEQSIRARRAGRPEPTWEQFAAARDGRSWATRLNEGRQDLGRLLYQKALVHYMSRRYPRLAATMLGAVALDPGIVLPRLLPRLLPSRRSHTAPAAAAPAGAQA